MRAPILLFSSLVLAVACSSSSSSPPSDKTDSGSATNDTGSTGNPDGSTDTTLPDGSTTADTWDNFAHDFITKYCIECHNATDKTGRDFTVRATVAANASAIRCGVAATKQSGCGSFPPPRQFPINDATGSNPKPTDDERNRIVAWIDAGMP